MPDNSERQRPGLTPSASRHARVRRDVVSFVRRSTRMNDSQRRALDRHGSTYLLQVPRGEMTMQVAADVQLDPVAIFGRTAPLAVEIGSGTGESLTAMAQAHPDWNILAFEAFERAIASTLIVLTQEVVGNVRVVHADGAQAFRDAMAADSVAELWTFFPDPWHKARHHKRRLVNPDFATVVARRLRPGGVWRLATDWDDYATAIREVLDAEPGLVNVYADRVDHQGVGWAPRDELRPVTKYENRGLTQGRVVHDLVYRRPG